MAGSSRAAPGFACPACGSTRGRTDVRTGQLRVLRCRTCGYRLAEHAPHAIDLDYHEQYEQGAFLESLAATRRRQSVLLLDLVRRHVPRPDRLLDYGAGRGWFLEACRAAGMTQLAGAETSSLAVNSLQERRIEAVLVPPVEEEDWLTPLRSLSFRPRIVSLLDVIEHLPPDRLGDVLGAMVQALRPELELVVVKVPDAGGLMYRTASAVRRVGLCSPIEQLYQVGTSPPHRSYFNRRSLVALLRHAGVEPIETTGDLDFEPESLAERAPSLRILPRAITTAGGMTAALVATRAGLRDALIIAAVPGSLKPAGRLPATSAAG